MTPRWVCTAPGAHTAGGQPLLSTLTAVYVFTQMKSLLLKGGGGPGKGNKGGTGDVNTSPFKP